MTDTCQTLSDLFPFENAFVYWILCMFFMFLNIDYISYNIIIVAFLENATIVYSLESVCVFVCVCFCTITQEEIDLGTRNRNTL